MLVLIGATPEGRKEVLGFQVGVRESAQNWRELLVDLKARGLVIAPELATGDGALGFWKALDAVSPATRQQRCTVHKTINIMDKLPKSVQPAAKADLREVWTAPDRATAEAAIGIFAGKYGAKYEKAVACLVKDRDGLLTFYDFPAEHWDHLRTSNPIESVFATVRHRTVRTKGALSQDTARLMVFKLIMAASKTWRRLKGDNQLPKVAAAVIPIPSHRLATFYPIAARPRVCNRTLSTQLWMPTCPPISRACLRCSSRVGKIAAASSFICLSFPFLASSLNRATASV